MKKISLLLTLLLVSVITFGQANEGSSTDLGRNTTFIKNGFWSNWFIGAGASANMYFGDNDASAKFMNRVTVAPTIQLGTWFNPYMGIRIKAAGGTNLHTFTNDATVMRRNRYISTEANLMWNVTDYLLNYNAKRVYSFIPYVGAGWAIGFDYSDNMANDKTVNSLTVDAGIINRFRFSEKVSLDIELSAKALRDDFDKRGASKQQYDLLASVSASLVYNFGKATFTEAVLRDQSEVDAMNQRINDLRSQVGSKDSQLSSYQSRIADLERQLAEKPKVITKEETEVEMNAVVVFKIGSAKLQDNQEINIFNAAKYLQQNPDINVVVTGYADKSTGTPAINQRLSEQRAQAVADIMIKKFGIDPARITTVASGDKEQPFPTDEWNRVVIFTVKR
ncbi:MAG: OmpA family protein [Dysgonomonas sp.]